MPIKNLEKAAKRIKLAAKSGQNIILFSDADLDGVASLIILEEAIKSLGGKVVLRYFPNREIEGYGLSSSSLAKIKEFSPGLLILSDTGITSFNEIEQAKEMGFFVLIIDHHQVLDRLPRANLIVDPKQAGDDYPFKLIAACGLCFKLAQLLLSGGQKVLDAFAELAALGTLADLMPLLEDNKELVEKGLFSLHRSVRPGLKVLIDNFEPQTLSSRELAGRLISVLQLTDFEKHFTESYVLLTESNLGKAQNLAKILIDKNTKRRDLIGALVNEIEDKIGRSRKTIIFEGGKHIPHLLTGNIASKLCNKFKKPSFIYSSKEKISRGSLRMPPGLDGVKALISCASLLEIYGGHPQAAGFTVKNENLEKFGACLETYFSI